MSARARFFLILPAMLIASWLAIRSPAADTARDLDDPPPAARTVETMGEVDDPALAALIARFAAEARNRDARR